MNPGGVRAVSASTALSDSSGALSPAPKGQAATLRGLAMVGGSLTGQKLPFDRNL